MIESDGPGPDQAFAHRSRIAEHHPNGIAETRVLLPDRSEPLLARPGRSRIRSGLGLEQVNLPVLGYRPFDVSVSECVPDPSRQMSHPDCKLPGQR